MVNRFDRVKQNERGETLIEFAFAAIIFLTIIFAVIEIGIAVWKYNIISNLAQEGARWASVRGNSTGAIQHATTTDVQNYVQSRSLGIPVTVTTTPSPDSVIPPAIVTVSVSTTVTPLTALVPFGVTVTSSAIMTLSR